MPGARVGLLLPLPQIKGSSCPGHTLATPSPTSRIEGAAPQTHAKPVGGATPTCALGITASWGLRILRLQVHPGLGQVPSTPLQAQVSPILMCGGTAQSRRSRTGAGQWLQRRGRAGSAPAHAEPRSCNPGVSASSQTTLPRGPRAWALRNGPRRRRASFPAQQWDTL